MVVVPKNEKSVCICVDFTKLNKLVKRPAYTAKTPKEAVMSVAPNSSIFSTFDATHGYWQMALDKDAQKLTTFITLLGTLSVPESTYGIELDLRRIQPTGRRIAEKCKQHTESI